VIIPSSRCSGVRAVPTPGSGGLGGERHRLVIHGLVPRPPRIHARGIASLPDAVTHRLHRMRRQQRALNTPQAQPLGIAAIRTPASSRHACVAQPTRPPPCSRRRLHPQSSAIVRRRPGSQDGYQNGWDQTLFSHLSGISGEFGVGGRKEAPSSGEMVWGRRRGNGTIVAAK